MKRYSSLLAFALVMVMGVGSAIAGVTIRYYNKDSQTYELTAVCSGSKKTFKFEASRTASVTIQGSGPCKVEFGGETHSFSGGENIRIHKGKIVEKK